MLHALKEDSVWYDEVPPVPPLESDPRDTMFLAVALAARADVIVSGDAHLLDLRQYGGVPILTARQFVEGSR